MILLDLARLIPLTRVVFYLELSYIESVVERRRPSLTNARFVFLWTEEDPNKTRRF